MNSPAYRRPLNEKQITILHSLYRFRFITSPLIAQLLNINQSKAHERLTILLEQDYIGRRYDKSYKLQGKAAIYYLLPKGIDALCAVPNSKYVPDVLRRLSKDENRSERFVNHWLNVFATYNLLVAQYGDRLRFFTNTELVPYKYFIQPRPDAYIRLDKDKSEKQFFLEYLDATMPRFAAKGRVSQYIEYAEEEEWQDHTKAQLPAVIFICENPLLKSKLKRVVAEELEDSWVEDDLKIRVYATSDQTEPMLNSN